MRMFTGDETVDDLVQRLSRVSAGSPLVEVATRFAVDAHGRQKRRGGAPYVTHPLRTGLSLAVRYREGFGGLSRDELVAAGVCHDVVEDCPTFRIRIAAVLPPPVLNVVDAVSKISRSGVRKPLGQYWLGIQSLDAACALKAEDRIDNLRFAAALNDPQWVSKYLDESFRLVLPLAPGASLGSLRGVCDALRDK